MAWFLVHCSYLSHCNDLFEQYEYGFSSHYVRRAWINSVTVQRAETTVSESRSMSMHQTLMHLWNAYLSRLRSASTYVHRWTGLGSVYVKRGCAHCLSNSVVSLHSVTSVSHLRPLQASKLIPFRLSKNYTKDLSDDVRLTPRYMRNPVHSCGELLPPSATIVRNTPRSCLETSCGMTPTFGGEPLTTLQGGRRWFSSV